MSIDNSPTPTPEDHRLENVLSQIEGAKVTVRGTKVRIEFDLATDIGPSNSGSSMLIVSSRGNVKTQVPHIGGVYFGINIYKFPQAKKRQVDYRDVG